MSNKVLDSKIPEGPIDQKWTKYKATTALVNPANKRSIEIIVVGTGLAGASAAASLGALGFRVKAYTLFPLILQHWAGVSLNTSFYKLAETCVFIKQSLSSIVCQLFLKFTL